MIRQSLLPAATLLAIACPGAIPRTGGCTVPGVPAAQDRGLDSEIADVKHLMREEHWEAAADALRKVLESRPGSQDVLDRIADIEEDLKLCTYRAQAAPPTARDLFGPCARPVAVAGRKVVLEFPDGPRSPEWMGGGKGYWTLPVRFADDVTIRFRSRPVGPEEDGVLAILNFDPDRETGYAVAPGFQYSKAARRHWLDTRILRMDGKSEATLESSAGPGIDDPGAPHAYRVSFRRDTVELEVETAAGGAAGKSLGKWTAKDARHRSGLVSLRGHQPTDVVVSGVLEEAGWRALLSRHHAAKFKEWAADSWRREEALPAWAIRATRPGASRSAGAVVVPPDAPSPLDPAAERALLAWRAGETREFARALGAVREVSPGLDLYLRGLASLGRGSFAQAEMEFTDLIRAAPGFGPAFLYRGTARFHRRKLEGARKDLEAAWEGSRSLPDLYLLAASLALGDGDLEKAQAHCVEARRGGALNPELERLGEWIRRSLRGPAFLRRFEQRTPHAVIATDHSQETANEAGRVIAAALAACAEEFPLVRPERPPMRVHLFSNRSEFVEYAKGLDCDLHAAAGAFVPALNEMVLFVPEIQREGLWRTVRHETFHAFVHGFVDRLPAWFDEGFAQWFEGVGEAGGRSVVAGVEAAAVRTLAAAGDEGLTPLKSLLLMDTPAFRERAELHYAQSQALVRFLNTREPYRAILRDFLRSIVVGSSPGDAYERHLAPLLETLDSGFRLWLRGVVRESEGK